MDSAGRLGAINTSGMGNTTVASNFQYRAWDALKHMDFGNNTAISLGYNSRMLPAQYALSGVKELSGQSRAEGSDFQYYEDGKVKFASDYYGRSLSSVSAHDKAYQYDHVGRMQTALTSVAANTFVATGQPGSNLAGPYQQNYTHDVWDNLANRTGSYWSEDDNTGTQTYDKNRNTAWSYDATGNLLSMNEAPPNGLPFVAAQHAYDAASRRVQTTTGAVYDGDGLQVKAAVTKQVNSNQPSTQTTYYLRSSVLGGQAITDYDDQGTRVNSYVYAGGNLIYEQLNGQNLWHVANPLTGDARDTDAQAKLYDETHLDPEGANTGPSDPASMSDPQQPPLPHAGAYAAFLPHSMGGSGRCSIDGSETGCAFAESFRDSGAGEECLDGNCGKQQVTIIGRNRSGQVVKRTTIDVMPGDPGWNGHLDGTYRVGSTLGNVDISNSSTAANLLQVFDYWGDRPNDYFGKMSAAPQNTDSSINHSQILNSVIEGVKKRLTGDCLKLFGNIDTLNYLANHISIQAQDRNGSSFAGKEGLAAVTTSYINARGQRLAGGDTIFNQDSFFFTGTLRGQPVVGNPYPEGQGMPGVFPPTSPDFGLGFNELQELIVLHEMFHANDVQSAYDDGTRNPQMNLRNHDRIDALIKEKCF
jgi:hypothetical protein